MAVAPMTPLDSESARRLHHDALVFDGHNDLAGPLRRGESIEDRDGRGHLDLERMRRGGFDGGIFAVFIDPDLPDAWQRTVAGVGALRATIDSHPAFHLVLEAADLVRESDDGRISVVIGVEGGYGIEDDLGAADVLFEAGVRCLTLTWNTPTAWADAAGTRAHGGLTTFGRKLVERLQRLGMLVDLSHASDATMAAAVECAQRPVVSSHTGMRHLARLPRNLPDRLLEAIAATGGMAGISLFNGHLDADFERRCAPLRERRFEDTEELARAVRREVGTLPLSAVVDHVLHAVRIAGTEHVGLGTDFDGMWALPEGLEDVSRLPVLSTALGPWFDATGLTAFLGANWRRVMAAALP